MDTSKLIPLDKRTQIITAFEKAASHGGDVWQTNSKGRILCTITQIYIDVKIDKIVIKVNDAELLDSNVPLFLKLNYRNLISRFDPLEFRVMGDRLICDYPASARALEERTNHRYLLPLESNISLSLRRVERSVKELPLEIELRIIDFSDKGFGIIISGANREFLNPYDHFWVKAVDQRTLRSMIFGSVCYIAPKGYYLKRGDVRIGLSLESSLAQECFDSLKKQSKKVLTA